MSMQPTEKQVEWLNKKNIPVPATKAEASKLLDAAFNSGESKSTGSGYSKKPYVQKTVKRNIPKGTPNAELQEFAELITLNAHVAAKNEYPEEDENGQQFGMANTKWQYIFTTKLTS